MAEDDQPLVKPEDRMKMPRWMRWAVGIFLAYLVFSAFQKTNEELIASEQAEQGENAKPERYSEIKKFADVDRWRLYANPGLGREIEFKDLVAGKGDTANCGQRVVLDMRPSEGYEDQPKQLPPEMPMQFVVGMDRAGLGEAVHRAVLGMREGGEREVKIGARLFDREAGIHDEPYYFMMKLATLSPNTGEGIGFTATVLRKGVQAPIRCDETLAVLLKVWSADNRKLYESKPDAPEVIHLGKGELGHGIDRGLVGIREGEIRRLMIPPPYLPEKSAIVFPKGEIAIVEVTRVSYKDSDSVEAVSPTDTETKPQMKEPDNEPDRQPTERHQTLPDDGGDRQGSGAESSR